MNAVGTLLSDGTDDSTRACEGEHSIPERLTATWLTATLRQSGALPTGEVAAIDVHSTDAFNSQTSRVVVRYSADASDTLPTNLVIKRNVDTDWGIEAGVEEVRFYRMINALTDHPPVTVPCYAAVHDSRSGRSCVVLQDLSETHTPPVTRGQQVGIAEGVPARVKIDQVMDTLAKLHAYWFDNPRLKRMGFDVGYWSRNEERFGKYLQRRRTAWEDLISGEGSWFPQDLRALYERVFDCLADHWQRYLQPRFDRRIDLTLVHGDAYFANFLCPIGDAPGPAYLLDWQSPTCDVGGYDLANLLATFWTPAQRMAEEREVRALRRYHSVLQSHGIQSDSWDDLTTDYRSGLIFWLLMPVQDRYGKAKRDYWWPKMQCLVAAFRDWDCEDLLRSS